MKKIIPFVVLMFLIIGCSGEGPNFEYIDEFIVTDIAKTRGDKQYVLYCETGNNYIWLPAGMFTIGDTITVENIKQKYIEMYGDSLTIRKDN